MYYEIVRILIVNYHHIRSILAW